MHRILARAGTARRRGHWLWPLRVISCRHAPTRGGTICTRVGRQSEGLAAGSMAKGGKLGTGHASLNRIESLTAVRHQQGSASKPGSHTAYSSSLAFMSDLRMPMRARTQSASSLRIFCPFIFCRRSTCPCMSAFGLPLHFSR